MSEPAVSVAFFDRERHLHGAARAGLTLLFEGSHPRAAAEGALIEPSDTGWRAGAADLLELELEPLHEPIALGGSQVAICRARGTAGGRVVDGLGTVTETATPPAWQDLDALRGISALFDEQNAVLCSARRPRGASGHGNEEVHAALLRDGELLGVEEARLSTVYDADGRQRSGGLELWLPGEDWPRRAFGVAAAGTTLQLDQLVVHAAVFSWRMEGREGVGAYDLAVREQPPAAA